MLTVLLVALLGLLAHELGSRRGNKQIIALMLGIVVLALLWDWQGADFLSRVKTFHMPDLGVTWPGH